jgi:crotonobetainyl-CoA:carnitine CoA-transferase CaiB-like acyl-CoA transferase
MPVAFAPADVVTGFALAWSVTAALYHRQRTGEGQAISSSLLLSALALQAGSREIVAIEEDVRHQKLAHLAEARARGASMDEIIRERRRFAPELAGNIYYRPYKTRDSYLVVGCLGPGPRARFREALAITDPRYEPGFDPARLHDVAAELVRICEERFLERTNDEWLAYLDRFDIACGPVRFVEELFDDPQVLANDYLQEFEHTLLGPIRGPAPVVRMTATPTRIQRASPALGEHTDAVLREVGFSDDAIDAFRADGLIG